MKFKHMCLLWSLKIEVCFFSNKPIILYIIYIYISNKELMKINVIVNTVGYQWYNKSETTIWFCILSTMFIIFSIAYKPCELQLSDTDLLICH